MTHQRPALEASLDIRHSFGYRCPVEIDAAEFPFVGELPKREAKRTLSLWETAEEFFKLLEQHGPPISFALAAKLLGVSKQRIHELNALGRFHVITSPDGKKVITGKSFVAFAEQERHSGRPTKLETASRFALMKAGISSLRK